MTIRELHNVIEASKKCLKLIYSFLNEARETPTQRYYKHLGNKINLEPEEFTAAFENIEN